jgi:hypothetical protein
MILAKFMKIKQKDTKKQADILKNKTMQFLIRLNIWTGGGSQGK